MYFIHLLPNLFLRTYRIALSKNDNREKIIAGNRSFHQTLVFFLPDATGPARFVTRLQLNVRARAFCMYSMYCMIHIAAPQHAPMVAIITNT